MSAFSTTSTLESYTGTTPSTTPSTSIASTLPAANALANWLGVYEISLPFYSGPFLKPYTMTRLGGPNLLAATGGGYWNNTAAISRVACSLNLGQFVAGSRLMVYGYN